MKINDALDKFSTSLSNAGFPALDTYTFQWLVLLGLALTMTLLLLILLFKPFRQQVSQEEEVVEDLTLEDFIDLAERQDGADAIVTTLRFLQIAQESGTIAEYFTYNMDYIENVLGSRDPMIKRSCEHHRKGLKT